MAQQTAVEWFFEVLAHNDIIDHKKLCDDENLYNLLYSLKNQAKQMEKEQIMKAVDRGFDEGCKFPEDITLKDAEQYYNETYGKP
jgi:hypothetical protein